MLVLYQEQVWDWIDDYYGKCIIQNIYTDEINSVERDEIEVI